MSDQRKERSRELFQAIRLLLGFPEVGKEVLAFSDRIGVENTSLSRWERGISTPRGQALDQLAANIGIPSELLSAYLAGNIELGVIVEQLAVNPLATKIAGLTIKELQQVCRLALERLAKLMAAEDLSRFLVSNALPLFRLADLLEFNRFFAAFLANRPIDPPKTIQALILKELAQAERPWTASSNPLKVFSDESMIDLSRLTQILDGHRPTQKEVGYLQRMLSANDGSQWTLEALHAFIAAQYHKDSPQQEGKPNGAAPNNY